MYDRTKTALKENLIYAYNHVPYYKQLFEKYDLYNVVVNKEDIPLLTSSVNVVRCFAG